MNFEEIYKEKRAIISCSGLCRYELHREWDIDKGKVLFIMLNPSTADGWENDLTTIRCMNFATKWGYGGISIGNIYPYRTKKPKHLRRWMKTRLKLDKRYFTPNVSHIRAMADEADITVCAWGCNHPEIPSFIDNLADEVPLYYLELCKDGRTPKHPLGNLSKDLKPKIWMYNTLGWGFTI